MSRAEAPPGAPPLVILPGFGNCSADYEAPDGDPEASIAAALRVLALTPPPTAIFTAAFAALLPAVHACMHAWP